MNRASSVSLNSKSKTNVNFPLNVLKPLKPRNSLKLKKYPTKDDISNRTEESTEKPLDLETLLEESVKYIAEKKPSAPFYLHKPPGVDEKSSDNEYGARSDECLSEHAISKMEKEPKVKSKKVTASAGGNRNFKSIVIDTSVHPALIGGPFGGPPNSKKESLEVVTERRRNLNRDHEMSKSNQMLKAKSRLKNDPPPSTYAKRNKSKSPPLVIPAGFLNIFEGDEKYKCPILNSPKSSDEKISSGFRTNRNSIAAYLKPNVSKPKFRPEEVDEAVQIKINERIRSIEKLKKQHEENKATSQKIRESLFGKSNNNK